MAPAGTAMVADAGLFESVSTSPASSRPLEMSEVTTVHGWSGSEVLIGAEKSQVAMTGAETGVGAEAGSKRGTC